MTRFNVHFDRNGTPVYTRQPIKMTYVCKCGARLAYWPDIIEAHKTTDCPLRSVA